MPQFTREHGVNCTTCHTFIPKLNSTGRNFLRSGFRFDINSQTTLQKVLNQNKDKIYIPIAVLLKANYSTYNKGKDSKKKRKVKLKAKLITSGTLTKNISYFANFKKKNYFQYNLKTQVLRAGFLNPFTPINSIDKMQSNLGVNANNKDCVEIFKLPIANSNIKNYQGAEYSVAFNDVIALASIGKTQGVPKHCQTKQDEDSAKNIQQLISLKYDGIFTIGGLYSSINNTDLTRYSNIIYLEKEFDSLMVNLTYLYKNNTKTDNYTGYEGLVAYTINDYSNIKLFGSYDTTPDKLYNVSLSVGYTRQFFNRLWLDISQSHRENQNFKDNISKAGIMIYY
jgi:hypothetical protein